jgi:cation transport ATPase
MILDKTETLTRGEATVAGIETEDDVDEVLAVAAAAESSSVYLLVQAILTLAFERNGIRVPEAVTDLVYPGGRWWRWRSPSPRSL